MGATARQHLCRTYTAVAAAPAAPTSTAAATADTNSICCGLATCQLCTTIAFSRAQIYVSASAAIRYAAAPHLSADVAIHYAAT